MALAREEWVTFETIALHEAAERRRGNLFLLALATAIAIIVAAVAAGIYGLR